MPLQSGPGRGASTGARSRRGSRRAPGAGGRDGDLRVLSPPVPVRRGGRGGAVRRGSTLGWFRSDSLTQAPAPIATPARQFSRGSLDARASLTIWQSISRIVQLLNVFDRSADPGEV